MKLVVFGLTISSSWGNGHATLWRGLARALVRQGVSVTFFERDVPWYANHRDGWSAPDVEVALYPDWDSVSDRARRAVREADAAMVTSYCPDGIAASRLVLDQGRGLRLFYDLDTPVTLAELSAGRTLDYIGPEGLGGFDLVFSYTGGRALDLLRDRLGARRAAPLYGHVDPAMHRPVAPQPQYRADLSYLGTYAADRQAALERLFIDPARQRPDRRFVIGGALYPQGFPWTDNIWFVQHLAPGEHPAFFASSRLTLNITRAAMAGLGWCPSGRLFEAAACGCPLLSDSWEGLEHFFQPGEEILIARRTEDTAAALDLPDATLARLAEAARARVLADHTADRRAAALLECLAALSRPVPAR